ncbi:MAG: PepSY domain-containing protein [Phycisphaerales bacterium]|jgi:uncharacterized iron-regulated membrane protein
MRKIHRWLSLLACLFLLVVGVTGVILQVQSLTSADEAERERLAEKASGFTVGASLDKPRAATDSLTAHAAKQLGDKAGIDWIEYRLRADPPRVVLHALKADGAPVQFTAKIEDGSIIGPANGEADGRESLLLRLHTGEVLGDGGVVGGILWGSAMVVLTISGMWMYYRMWSARRRSLGAAVERGAPQAKTSRFGGLLW